MMMSRKIRSGFSALALSRASLPLVAVKTRQPASVTMFLILVRSVRESSTTRTFLIATRYLLYSMRDRIVKRLLQIFFDHGLKLLTSYWFGQIGITARQLAADAVKG